MNVGSAKPSIQDFQDVPHYLFDYVEEGDEITAGEFSRDFFANLKKIENQFPVVFVVGGTGFYFQAIEKGMYPIGAADAETLKKVEAELAAVEGAERLHAELKEKDPKTAEKISINDHYRLARAIEMMRTHGKPVSEIKKEFEEQQTPFPYPLFKLGFRISKEELLPRVRKRTEHMLKAGLVNEVKNLLAKNLESWAPLQSVGYKETVEYLNGSIGSEIELCEKIIQNTMRLAKKQRTWFQRDSSIFWVSPENFKEAQEKVRQFLSY